jgi:large subunit ribosomal protein L30
MAAVEMRQVRSANRSSRRQRDTLRSLGRGRIGSRASHADTPQLRGMLRVVEHLIEVNGKAEAKG